MNPKTRQVAIQAWRALAPAQQEAERLRQIPVKVARSMAFEGEPVPKGWVEAPDSFETRWVALNDGRGYADNL